MQVIGSANIPSIIELEALLEAPSQTGILFGGGYYSLR
jgi:hypothetical protein